MDGSHYVYELTLHEREIIRRGLLNSGSLTFSEMCGYLESSAYFTRKIIKSLIDKRILRPTNPMARRHHRYILEVDAYKLLR